MATANSPVGDVWRTIDATTALMIRYDLDIGNAVAARQAVVRGALTLDDALAMIVQEGEKRLKEEWTKKDVRLFFDKAGELLPSSDTVRQLYEFLRGELRMRPAHALMVARLLKQGREQATLWEMTTEALKCVFDVTDQTLIYRRDVFAVWEGALASPRIVGTQAGLFMELERLVMGQLQKLLKERNGKRGYRSNLGPTYFGFKYFGLDSLLPPESPTEEFGRLMIQTLRNRMAADPESIDRVLQQMAPPPPGTAGEAEEQDMEADDWAEVDADVLTYLRNEFDDIRARLLEYKQIEASGEADDDRVQQWLSLNALQYQRLRDGLGALYRLVRGLNIGPVLAGGLVQNVDMPASEIISGVRATMAAGRLSKADAIARFATTAPKRLSPAFESARLEGEALAAMAFQTGYYLNEEAADLLRRDLAYRYEQIVEAEFDRAQRANDLAVAETARAYAGGLLTANEVRTGLGVSILDTSALASDVEVSAVDGIYANAGGIYQGPGEPIRGLVARSGGGVFLNSSGLVVEGGAGLPTKEGAMESRSVWGDALKNGGEVNKPQAQDAVWPMRYTDTDGTEYAVSIDELGVKRYLRLSEGQPAAAADPAAAALSPDEILAKPDNIALAQQYLCLPVKAPADCPESAPLLDEQKTILAAWMDMDRTRANFDKLLRVIGDDRVFIYDDNGQRDLRRVASASMPADPVAVMQVLGDPFARDAVERSAFIDAWGLPIYDAELAALLEAAWAPHEWRAAMFMWGVTKGNNELRQLLSGIVPELAALRHGDQIVLARVTTRHAFVASEVVPRRAQRQHRQASQDRPALELLDEVEARGMRPRRL